MMKPDTVHMTMAELIDCGPLTKVHTDSDGIPKRNAVRIEVGESLTPDSNPLSFILLQEVVRRIEDVTHIERWVLLVMARNYDWSIEASVIDCKRARSEYPWLSKHQWRARLSRLRQRGIITNVKGGNHLSAPHYSLTGLLFYIDHCNASETDRSLIYARAELPIVEVVEDHDTTTSTGSFGNSGAVVTSEFEAALIRSVISERGEEYIPGEYDSQGNRLNPLRRSIRQYAWERQAAVHPTQAVRLRNFIDSADWLTQRWGRVVGAKDLLEMWVKTGEDLSQPCELLPEPGEIAPVKYRDLVENRADPEAQRNWTDALGQLHLHVTRPNFETWLKHSVGLEVSDGHFVVGAPNAFITEMWNSGCVL